MFLLRSINAFFFTKQTSLGFGLMRASWAGVTLLFMLFQWGDVSLFYSQNGLIPSDIAQAILRQQYHFTIFSWITSPDAVFAVYLFFLATLTCMLLGIFPRISTILSVLLLFSFHERNPFILGGGDTLLRNIGFILMISPGISSVTVWPWHRHDPTVPKIQTMPVWPYRLLLWQMIILYGTSFWYKAIGTLWWHGTAVDIALHHPMFARWPIWFMSILTPVTPVIDWLSLAWEGLWLLLLVPYFLIDLFPAQIPRIPLRRILMLCGIFFHGAIFILMDAGSFSLAVFVAYCGLLRGEDFLWLESVWQRVKSLLQRT